MKMTKNEMKQFIRQHNWLFMRNGVLYCKTEMSHPDRSTMHLLLPEAFRKQALQGCHDDLGHLGKEWTIDLLRDHFYWPRMLIDVNNTSNNVRDVKSLKHY